MTGDVIPREQAIAGFCRARDAALDRLSRDYAAGRLTPEAMADIDRKRLRPATAPHRAAA